MNGIAHRLPSDSIRHLIDLLKIRPHQQILQQRGQLLIRSMGECGNVEVHWASPVPVVLEYTALTETPSNIPSLPDKALTALSGASSTTLMMLTPRSR